MIYKLYATSRCTTDIFKSGKIPPYQQLIISENMCRAYVVQPDKEATRPVIWGWFDTMAGLLITDRHASYKPSQHIATVILNLGGNM